MRPLVIAFCGLPGSGKSTLARELERRRHWQRLDRDILRTEIFAQGGYTETDKQVLADVLCRRMQACIGIGQSVILDGMTFSSTRERKRFETAARAMGGRWLLVYLQCDVETAGARVAADHSHPANDRDCTLVRQVAARFEIPDQCLQIDSLLSVNQQLVRLLDHIESIAGDCRET